DAEVVEVPYGDPERLADRIDQGVAHRLGRLRQRELAPVAALKIQVRLGECALRTCYEVPAALARVVLILGFTVLVEAERRAPRDGGGRPSRRDDMLFRPQRVVAGGCRLEGVAAVVGVLAGGRWPASRRN